jgi:hypothetical protein
MQFQKIIRIKECPRRADTAQEHSDPGIRLGDSSVMLSAAKHLSARRERPCAALRSSALNAREWGDSVEADFIIRLIY